MIYMLFQFYYCRGSTCTANQPAIQCRRASLARRHRVTRRKSGRNPEISRPAALADDWLLLLCFTFSYPSCEVVCVPASASPRPGHPQFAAPRSHISSHCDLFCDLSDLFLCGARHTRPSNPSKSSCKFRPRTSTLSALPKQQAYQHHHLFGHHG